MPTAATIFWGFVFPGLLVAAVLFQFRRAWVTAAAISVGFAIAFWNLQGPAAFPPTDAVQWIFWFTVPLAVLGILDSFLQPPAWPRFVIVLVAWRVGMRALIGRLVPSSVTSQDLEFWIDAGSAIVLIWWLAAESIAERVAGNTTPLLLSILSAGVGLFIFTTLHIQREGMLAMSLAGMCFAAAVAAWWNPKITLARGGVQTIVLILLSLMTFAWFYTNDTLTNAQQWRVAALMASPLLAFAGDFPVINRLRPPVRLMTRLLAVGLVVAIVGGLCVRDYVQAERASAAAAAGE